MSEGRRLQVFAPQGIPRIQADTPLTECLLNILQREGIEDGDVITVTSKLFSRAEGRFVWLPDVEITDEARQLSQKVDKDPALVTLILQESTAVSRAIPGVLIVRHRLGMVCANAGIDRSNAMPKDASKDTRGQWALLLPQNPDRSAEQLRAAIAKRLQKRVGVVITDSHGRPFREGSVGIAIGAAGITVLDGYQGREDLDGRELEVTTAAIGDQIAAAADLLAGQADEGTPIVIFRGLECAGTHNAHALIRDPKRDLYAPPIPHHD